MISCSQLSLSYGEHTILNQFSIDIPSEGITALSGPSGCGKTSLLRILAGLVQQQTGTVTGFDPQKTAIQFQENRLFPWRTVEEHLTDVLPPHRASQLSHLLSLAQLEQAAKQLPKALSGGMQRRLSFVRTLALDASLYLLDEPFTGVDLPRITILMDFLKLLQLPVILSTHETEVLQLADRVIVLDGPPLRVIQVISHHNDVFL